MIQKHIQEKHDYLYNIQDLNILKIGIEQNIKDLKLRNFYLRILNDIIRRLKD